jgi:hypothetical protein
MSGGGVLYFRNSTAAAFTLTSITLKEVTDPVGLQSYYTGATWLQRIPNMTLSGDVAAVLSIVTDETELKAAKLDHLTNGYKVYKVINPSGGSLAVLTLAGTVTSGVTSTMKVFYRQTDYSTTADIQMRFSGTTAYGLVELSSATYTTATLTATPTVKSLEFVVKPNKTLYFLLPQLEEQPFATSLIPTSGATAQRVGTVEKVPLLYHYRAGQPTTITQYWTPLGYKVGVLQYIMSSRVDANNYTACWYNGVIVCVEKCVAGVKEYVTFPLTAVLGQRYLVEMLAYPDGTMGLMVDGVSAQSGLGSEVITDPNFDDTALWNKGTGWSVSGGKAIATASPAGQRIDQGTSAAITALLGKVVKVIAVIDSITGNIQTYVYNLGPTLTAAGTYTEFGVCAGLAIIGFRAPSGAVTCQIDSLSVKEVYNNTTNATQPVFGTYMEIGSFNGAANAQGVLAQTRIGRI